MKSERAKSYLKNNREQVEINWETGETEWMIWPQDARKAVELAEQDAEARMREKAIQAYCSECSCYQTGVCALDPDKCATKLLFVEKMTER